MLESIFAFLLGPAGMTVGGSVIALFKSIKFIHEGEQGIILRFGKAKRD